MPEFSGGYSGLAKYISTNLHYPEQAVKNKVSGVVCISFVINADGSITDVAIIKGIGNDCDREVTRLITSMPPWKPRM